MKNNKDDQAGMRVQNKIKGSSLVDEEDSEQSQEVKDGHMSKNHNKL